MQSTDLKFQNGLALRPIKDSDQAFNESLYRSTRQDLRLIDAEDDFIEELIDMQHRAQTQGYGDMFPNAMYFIAEYHSERIGRVVLDFGHNEVRVVDIALITAARGRGYGAQILQAVQTVAGKILASVALTVRMDNPRAKQLYLSLGFVVEEEQVPYQRMVWYPRSSGTFSIVK